MTYWDTSYLAKLYLREPGTDEVLAAFSANGDLVCGEHGRLELMAAFKRQQREGRLTAAQLKMIWEKHGQDLAAGVIQYLPLPSELFQQACQQTAALPPSVFIRAGDALHLACARDTGLKEIYSHDRHLLAAASHFGLRGSSV